MKTVFRPLWIPVWRRSLKLWYDVDVIKRSHLDGSSCQVVKLSCDPNEIGLCVTTMQPLEISTGKMDLAVMRSLSAFETEIEIAFKS